MDEQNKPSDSNTESGSGSGYGRIVSIILGVIVIVAGQFLLPKILNNDTSGKKSSNEAIAAAEKYVNHQVYTSLGVACERYSSEVIYKEGERALIAVRFYLPDATSPNGSYCVYCYYGSAINSTKMMGADYRYKDNLPNLKALFGI